MTALNGQVVDLSASGAQILLRERPAYAPGERCSLIIRTGSQSLRLDAQVAWIRREGLFNPVWKAGLMFLDTRPAVRRLIETLAVTGYADPRSVKSGKYGTGAAAASASAGASGDGSHAPNADVTATIEPPDLYEVMGVARDADAETIRARYHALVRTLHPDSGSPDADAERFAMVAKAYSVLRDPEMRARYDERYPPRSAA